MVMQTEEYQKYSQRSVLGEESQQPKYQTHEYNFSIQHNSIGSNMQTMFNDTRNYEPSLESFRVFPHQKTGQSDFFKPREKSLLQVKQNQQKPQKSNGFGQLKGWETDGGAEELIF